tara:strand:+ start:1064 stop:1699 length:636 start_codon:yes stop_codon:yes gene_type:complete
MTTNLLAEDFWTQAMNIHYNHRLSHFNSMVVQKGSLIFLGDSITEQCNWSELFNDKRMVNRGIGGDVVEGVYDRLGFLMNCEPDALFLLIGINNLNRGDSIKETFEGYKKIVNRIKNYNPKLQLYILSILPINKEKFLGEPKITNKKIAKLNKKLKNLAKTVNAVYLDLNSKYLDSNLQLSSDYSIDGLHLNGDGYLLFKDIVKKYLHEKQ